MPGTTNPPGDRPVPKKIKWKSGSHSFMNCADDLAENKRIWDYDTLVADEYQNVPADTYETEEGQFVTVIIEGGASIIESVS